MTVRKEVNAHPVRVDLLHLRSSSQFSLTSLELQLEPVVVVCTRDENRGWSIMVSGSSKKKKNNPNRSSPIFRSTSAMASLSSSSSSSRSSFHFTKKLLKPILLLSVSFFVSTLLLIIFIIISKRNNSTNFEAVDAKFYSIEVINEFPHDPKAFTQGLLYGGNDTLYESTGLHHQSSVRKVALQTGKVEILEKMDGSYFGEGLTLLGERLFQVTWRQKTGFIYDRSNLRKIEKFTHQMPDGWGLATDGKVLFGSDGSSTLYQLNPRTLQVIESATVKYKDYEIYNLNELEYINGEVWANVWQTDCIARISPKDSSVLGWILLPDLRKQLLAAGNRQIDVLNGIAWDSEKNRLFVTGKLWPKLYEIKLHPIKEPPHSEIKQLCLSSIQYHF